jgi:multidrug resistance protein
LAAVPARAQRRPLPPGFATIWTTVALDLVGFGIIIPILPIYARQLDVTPLQIGTLFAAFSIAQLLFAPVWGRISDRIGRKPVLVVSLFGTALGSVITGLSHSLLPLLIGRIIDGLSGASVSVAHAAVADVAEPEDRPRLMGLLGAAFGVGFVVGPALGALAGLGGAHVPFFVAAAIAAINAVAAIRRLPETHTDRQPVEETSPLIEDPGTLTPVLLRLVAVVFVSMVAFSAFETAFPLLGIKRFGWGESATGVVFTLIGLLLMVVQGGVVGHVAERRGEVRTIRTALCCNAIGLALLAPSGGWALLVASLFLLVVGQGLLTPTLTSAVAGRAHSQRRGATLGIQQSASGLGRVVGPLLGGLLFGHIGPAAPFVAGAGLVVVAIGLAPRRDVARVDVRTDPAR